MNREFAAAPSHQRLLRREVWLVRTACGLLAAAVLALSYAAWRERSQVLYDAFVASFFAMSLAVAAMAAIPRRRQHQRDSAWAERFHELAIRDDLTGLYNRRYFGSALELAVSRARATRTPLLLVMLDLDHLKDINDAFGHAAGDHAIRLVAAAVLASIEGTGDVARVGGDEFAVIVPKLGTKDAQSLLDGIRDELRLAPIIATAGYQFALSASAGAAALQDGMDAEDLLHAADQALYAAKSARLEPARVA